MANRSAKVAQVCLLCITTTTTTTRAYVSARASTVATFMGAAVAVVAHLTNAEVGWRLLRARALADANRNRSRRTNQNA